MGQGTEAAASVSQPTLGDCQGPTGAARRGESVVRSHPCAPIKVTHIGGTLPENRGVSLSGCVSRHRQGGTRSPAAATHPATLSASTPGDRYF